MTVIITHEHLGPPQALLCLPSPPSVNRYWRHVVIGKGASKRATTLLSREARAFKEAVAEYCLVHKIPRLEGVLAVHIDWYRPRKIGDVDSILKSLLDAMQGFVYANDAQIAELYVRRFDDKERPRVDVAVCVMRGF